MAAGRAAILVLFLVSVTAAQNITYDTYYFTQVVDHFAFDDQDTWQQRYLVNVDSWDENGGPIFFYTGNEGDITMFVDNTGFVWEIAPEFKAMVVFAEHRYYGLSMPYGNKSYDLDKVGWLTSEQALADYADLITYIKNKVPGAGNSPVVAFGGSYGGMLSAWARIKYPHIYVGAIASSAPILQFEGITPCSVFYQIVTNTFNDASSVCVDTIRKSWAALNNKAVNQEGLQYLSNTFKTCNPITNEIEFDMFKYWLSNAWTNLAMINYPYPANFLEPLPAWPVQGACSYLNGTYTTDEENLEAIANAAFFYYNYTGENPCINIVEQATPDLGDLGWAYQSCTEMVMPMCPDGVEDMFEPEAWNLTVYAEGCRETWKTTPRPFMAPIIYGGPNISASSNIVFTNGKLDPWSGGGVLESISDTLVAIYMDNSAHHLDLRSSNPADPQSVVDARVAEKQYIQQWITGSGPTPAPAHAKSKMDAAPKKKATPNKMAAVLAPEADKEDLYSNAIEAILQSAIEKLRPKVIHQ